MKGTFLENFNQLGGTNPGPAMPLRMKDADTGTGQIMPNSGFVRNLKKYDADRDFNSGSVMFPNGINFPEADHSNHVHQLSPGIMAKARVCGVDHIIGQHKEQSNFVGGAGIRIGLMEPSDIIAYNNFLGALSPQEQHEYSEFLGINFNKIGKAIGGAAKTVGKGIGAAGKAVGHVAVGVGRTAGKIGVGIAHVGRDIGVGTAHVAAKVGVGVAHGARAVGKGALKGSLAIGKFTWKNLPYLAAAAAIFIPALGPEVAAGLLGAIASMKAAGKSDAEIDQAMQDQGAPSVLDAQAGEDEPGDDASQYLPDANGDVDLGDGSKFNVDTGTFSDPDGLPIAKDAALPAKNTDWLLYIGIAAVLGIAGYYLYKHKKFPFAKLK